MRVREREKKENREKRERKKREREKKENREKRKKGNEEKYWNHELECESGKREKLLQGERKRQTVPCQTKRRKRDGRRKK